MPKSKKKRKFKKREFSTLVTLGAIFHFITYLYYNHTFYSDSLFWSTAILMGILGGFYLFKALRLHKDSSYRKIKGGKLQALKGGLFVILCIGALVIFGNLINGSVLGLNYWAKSALSQQTEYAITDIVSYRSYGRRRSLALKRPRVYFAQDGQKTSYLLPERYDSKKDYSVFHTLQLRTAKGFFGFEVIESYQLLP
ncbi:hypothetical protein ABV409_05455 [Flagellimonas sp. DF-77]|uniref:hypothetical protein n=1 Tax=Flagellimonas algarum TaxID=3230298 RepID=UPI0033942489